MRIWKLCECSTLLTDRECLHVDAHRQRGQCRRLDGHRNPPSPQVQPCLRMTKWYLWTFHSRELLLPIQVSQLVKSCRVDKKIAQSVPRSLICQKPKVTPLVTTKRKKTCCEGENFIAIRVLPCDHLFSERNCDCSFISLNLSLNNQNDRFLLEMNAIKLSNLTSLQAKQINNQSKHVDILVETIPSCQKVWLLGSRSSMWRLLLMTSSSFQLSFSLGGCILEDHCAWLYGKVV